MVYITTSESFPNGMAAVNRIICLAKAFNEAGIESKILLFSREDTSGKIPARGYYDGVPYEFVGGSSKRAKGFVMGKIQAVFLKLRLSHFLNANLKANDVVYGYINQQNYLVQMIINIVHRHRAFYIRELCEYPFGTSSESKKTIKGREYEIKHLFPKYDGIIAISESLVNFSKDVVNKKCVITKVPILVDFNKYNIPDSSEMAEVPYIFHSGTLYEQKDGILGMIEAYGEAIKRMSRRVDFILTGNVEKSPHKLEILQLIEKYNLHGLIHFTGYLSKDELRDKLSKASLVIINKYPTRQNEYNFSTKLGEYMAAGKPIIITRVGEAMNWLKDKETAYIIDSKDSKQMIDAIIEVFENEEDRRRVGENARIFCKHHFDYRANAILLKNTIETICKERG